jgi:hypothetical protein
VKAPSARRAVSAYFGSFSRADARPSAWMPVACAMPLIHGGVPPPKWNRYSHAMKLRPRFTASAVISSRMRRSAASSQLGSCASQNPCRWFAFLNVESGCS